MDINKEDVNFGDYCSIEQKRYGAPNETYGYKVIGRKKSTSWIDVPVDANNPNPKNHGVLEDVFTAVAIGLDDTTVHQFRVADITRAWQAAKAQAVPEGFVLASNENITTFYQDDGEPENFCTYEADLDNLGDGLDEGEIMVVNKYTQVEISKEKFYGAWVLKEAHYGMFKKFEIFNTYDEAKQAMIEAQEQRHE